MSYTHIPLRVLTNPPAEEAETIKKHVDSARNHNWKYWLDDVPVSSKLFQYGHELQKSYPNIKFFCKARHFRDVEHVHGVDVFFVDRVCVCLESSPYALATIGFFNPGLRSGPHKYVLYARGIQNDMFHNSRKQYHMRSSLNLKPVLKVTQSYLIPYTLAECATLDYDLICRRSDQAKNDKQAVLRKLVDAAMVPNVFTNEVRHLMASGVTFLTPEFKALAAGLDEATQLSIAERNRRVDMVMVHFIDRSGEVVAECVEVKNIRGNNKPVFDGGGITTYRMTEVPQFIVEKVSVLQTLDKGTFIDSVGMKLDDKLFWVER